LSFAGPPGIRQNISMSDNPNEPEATPDEQSPPDGWGSRPTDPNELAKWMVEQTTSDADEEKTED